MQTFLPYPDFNQTMGVLDWKRLGKQRVECKQILNALNGTGGWSRHPAVLMWRGHALALQYYMDCAIREWVRRGYRNTMPLWGTRKPAKRYMPDWLGDPVFHASHRSNLLRKDPTHYGQFGWVEAPDLEYVWPVQRLD